MPTSIDSGAATRARTGVQARRRWPCIPHRPARLLGAALGMLLAACATTELRQGPGGLPAEDAARVSLIVAQTRAQLPGRSATAVPYHARKLPGPGQVGAPELALRGTGVGVTPGLKRGQAPQVDLALYLEKRRYAAGYAKVGLPGAAEEIWPIVAYDQRGDATEAFDFTYVLATPAGNLRYLSVVGGRYEEGDDGFLGFEGTLVVPGAGNDLERWERAFKIDFGYRFPAIPLHQRKVEEAGRIFTELARDIRELERLKASLAARSDPPPEDQDTGQTSAEAAAKSQSLRVAHSSLVDDTERRFLRYYYLRRTLSDDYVAFVTTNHYRWQDRAGKQAIYDAWKAVEFHHPRIDELVTGFLPHTKAGGKVLETRTAAMDTITRNNNWGKDHAREVLGQ